MASHTPLSAVVSRPGGAVQQQTLANLPVVAQSAVSSAIGQDQSAYHAASAAAGVSLANPANGFTANVQSGALHVFAGSDTWDMSLVGLAYGGTMQPVGKAKTLANGNRVDSNYGTIDEWYVNGPSGLEQGFTVPPLPQSEATGSLTVELALDGNLKSTVNASGDGLTLFRPDGSAALGYTELTAYDAAGKTLPAALEVRADGDRQDLLIRVDTAGAQGVITIDPFVQQAEFTASDGATQQYFGSSVAISGTTVVVGSPHAWLGSQLNQTGAVYVFNESTSGWANLTQIAKLTADDNQNPDSNPEFGASVSISGNTIVVGSPMASEDGILNEGVAFVFVEPASGWTNMTQTAKLKISDEYVSSQFGSSVSVSGNTVVVGAEWGWVGTNEPGTAYVFVEPGSGWVDMTESAKLDASDGVSGDEFGIAVSINGDTILVGLPDATVGSNSQQGAAYVFTGSGAAWAQTAKLTASDGMTNNLFGISVSISGNTAVIGSPQTNSVAAPAGNGAAYVFTGSGAAWTQSAKLTASDGAAGDDFGVAVRSTATRCSSERTTPRSGILRSVPGPPTSLPGPEPLGPRLPSLPLPMAWRMTVSAAL